ncbi:MAG: hypothetical protein MSG64_14755 [Pyrinomonadaceae bacterium MAG19_C2-C3]|nr:hypothetical protein [Pyrinomonadaceae bacterium MAG19_C2-C3]
MTNEEMERIMNFIIERQEVFAERMVQSDERLTRVEQITAGLAVSNDQNNQQIKLLITQVDRIAETLTFLLDERKNNKNGNGNI